MITIQIVNSQSDILLNYDNVVILLKKILSDKNIEPLIIDKMIMRNINAIKIFHNVINIPKKILEILNLTEEDIKLISESFSPITEEELLEKKIFLLKKKRDELLQASDWTQLPDVDLSEFEKEQWKNYRQAVRNFLKICDIKSNNLIWPKPPK